MRFRSKRSKITQNTTKGQTMDNYQSIIRSMLALSLKKNYRMSDRQLTLLEWNQIIGGTIKMRGTGREVHLTPEEQAALRTIPIHGRFVFSTSPFEPVGAPKESLRDKITKKIPKMPKIHLTVER